MGGHVWSLTETVLVNNKTARSIEATTVDSMMVDMLVWWLVMSRHNGSETRLAWGFKPRVYSGRVEEISIHSQRA